MGVEEVLGGLAATAVGAAVVWKLAASTKPLVSAFLGAVRRPFAKKSPPPDRAGADLLSRLETLQVGDSQAFRERLTQRARSKRAAAQKELGALGDEGRALLDRLDHWKQEDEHAWREDFRIFARRLRDGARWHLTAGVAHSIDLQCETVRQQPWPAFVSITEPVQGRASIHRSNLKEVMEALLGALAAGIDAMAQTPLQIERADADCHSLDDLTDEAREILQQIAQNAVVSDDELWKLVHGWRDKMADTLTSLESREAADYVTSAPPAKSVLLAHVADVSFAQMQTMRQLEGWLDRLKAWRYENVPGVDES